MIVIALDLATKLGWASKRTGKKPKYGTKDFHNTQWDSAGSRYYKFRAWLLEQLEQSMTEDILVAYESVEAHTSTYAGHVYGGYLAIMQELCEEKGATYVGYPVGTIKKYWTGKGTAKKDAMILEAQKRGYNPETDNDADALAILHLAIEDLKIRV
jgi:Holliday junction resolvasome RuvABC endonuclease subunit